MILPCYFILDICQMSPTSFWDSDLRAIISILSFRRHPKNVSFNAGSMVAIKRERDLAI
jgi:hypothetical protein